MHCWQASAVLSRHSEAADTQHSMQLLGVSLSSLWVVCVRVPSFVFVDVGMLLSDVCTLLCVCPLLGLGTNCVQLLTSVGADAVLTILRPCGVHSAGMVVVDYTATRLLNQRLNLTHGWPLAVHWSPFHNSTHTAQSREASDKSAC